MGLPFIRGLELADGVGIAPTQPGGSLGFRDRGITALPTIRNGQGGRSCPLVAVRKHPPRSDRGRLRLTLHPEILAARVGLAPTPNGLTGRRATLTLPGNGAAGRILTCIVPLRRRVPDIFDHGSSLKWSERQDSHLRPPGPRPGALKTE